MFYKISFFNSCFVYYDFLVLNIWIWNSPFCLYIFRKLEKSPIFNINQSVNTNRQYGVIGQKELVKSQCCVTELRSVSRLQADEMIGHSDADMVIISKGVFDSIQDEGFSIKNRLPRIYILAETRDEKFVHIIDIFSI